MTLIECLVLLKMPLYIVDAVMVTVAFPEGDSAFLESDFPAMCCASDAVSVCSSGHDAGALLRVLLLLTPCKAIAHQAEAYASTAGTPAAGRGAGDGAGAAGVTRREAGAGAGEAAPCRRPVQSH